MRIVFFGTGDFGIPTLRKLLKSGHEVAAVVTQPDRRRGRGYNVLPSAVKSMVGKVAPEIDVLQPEKASSPEFIDEMRKLRPDLFIVIDYGQILKKDLLEVPSRYCINLHPSLLPKYRGAAPVNHALLNGEKETGNTVYRMNERMDAGAVIAQAVTEIKEDEDAEGLMERLSLSGADLVMEVLEKIEDGRDAAEEQSEKDVTFAGKLTKKDGEVDWSDTAENICRKVRAMKPWPGAYTHLEGRALKIIRAAAVDFGGKGDPGSIVGTDGLTVRAGEGAVRIEMLQLEGKKAMVPDEFLRGHRIGTGTVLGK